MAQARGWPNTKPRPWVGPRPSMNEGRQLAHCRRSECPFSSASPRRLVAPDHLADHPRPDQTPDSQPLQFLGGRNPELDRQPFLAAALLAAHPVAHAFCANVANELLQVSRIVDTADIAVAAAH